MRSFVRFACGAAIITLSVPRPAQGQESGSCVAALDSLRSLFQHDYPGYREKVAHHERQLAALTDSVRAIARTSDQQDVCIPALQRWTAFFRDPHVTGPWQSHAPAPAPSATASHAESTAPARDDPERPSLRYLDDSTAVIRLPTFEGAYKPAIDSLMDSNATRLRALPYLIIDVRGNGGGYTGSYEHVTPLLRTGPVQVAGADVWASPGNLAWYRTVVDTDFFTPRDRALIQAALARGESRPNQFVELDRDTVIPPDTVFPLPRHVVVLVDSGCASSCEDFVLEARQSRKVTTLGTHTRGMMDYGNTRGVWLPGWRRVSLPSTRTHGPRIDNVGIMPAVRIPDRETDAVEFARAYLYAQRAP